MTQLTARASYSPGGERRVVLLGLWKPRVLLPSCFRTFFGGLHFRRVSTPCLVGLGFFLVFRHSWLPPESLEQPRKQIAAGLLASDDLELGFSANRMVVSRAVLVT